MLLLGSNKWRMGQKQEQSHHGVLPVPKLGQVGRTTQSTHLFSPLETTVAMSQGRMAFDTVVTVTISPPPSAALIIIFLTAAPAVVPPPPPLSSVLFLAADATVVTTVAVDAIAA